MQAGPAALAQAAEEEVSEALDLIRDGNVEAGVDMLRRIGELGSAEAFFHLAEIHRLGAGKEAAPPVAMMYYRLAAQMGNKQAALNLANILFFEEDTEASIKEAMAIWQQYALLGDVEATYLLGMLYWNGDGQQVADPVRGYGLMWRAAQAGYGPAAEAEPDMRLQLAVEAQEAGEAYGRELEIRGFSAKPLDLHLVTDDVPELPQDSEGDAKPEDWEAVWRLEVGFAMREEDSRALQRKILAEEKSTVADLFSEIVESPNRPGLYRLLFGPIGGMQDAVNRCVALKRAGHDCFAKPPR
jgi:TPR repeat protein